MQKIYRDFTVGELLDMGLNVEVRKHNVKTDEEGMRLISTFEGCKRSNRKLTDSDTKVYKAWKGMFKATFFNK